MSKPAEVDGVLVQWGDRLFYPGNRMVRAGPPFGAGGIGRRAAAIRRHIQATVRRAPQVMVKVTGGGRGMRAIRAHLSYISRGGQLEVEDERGIVREGRAALHDLAEQWQRGGSFIDERSHRREAFNVMLSMPSGTDPHYVQRAAREFAQAELKGHRYVLALHDDQANPHVHISVRAEPRDGERLNPRKPDLQRWRETFAEKLRGWGIDAEATRQAARGQVRTYPSIWRVKAREEDRLRKPRPTDRSGKGFEEAQTKAKEAWDRVIASLSTSERAEDRALAAQAEELVRATPFSRNVEARREQIVQAPQRSEPAQEVLPSLQKDRPGPDISRGR
jgi:Relaxase/Mobilisation nuclease domain